MSTRLPASCCPVCGYKFDAASKTSGGPDRDPQEGDVTVCIGCLAILTFNEDLSVRLPTEEDWKEIRKIKGLAAHLAKIVTMMRAVKAGLN
jgi:hypothetical protein